MSHPRSVPTVDRTDDPTTQLAAGVIPHRRFGKHYRFSRSDVDAMVRQMERTARPSRTSLRAA